MRILTAASVLILAACADPSPPPSIAPPPSLETIAVAPESTQRERVWDGVVEAVDQATLSAQTSGRVLELPFDVNDYVAAGEVVVRFTDVEQQSAQRRAQAALSAAEAAFTEAEADFARISEIFERRLVPRAQLDQATARRDAARAQLDSARASLREAGEQVDYTVIRAPYSGILTQRHVQVGETVRPGQALVSGLSLARLRINVDVPEGEIDALRREGRAALVLDDGRRIEAASLVIFPFADPQTHSFRVRVDLPEVETGLHPGMTVKVAFAIGSGEAVRIPATALVRRSEVSAVYVLGEARLNLRQVRTGRRIDDRIEILAGLTPGDRVVLDPGAAARWLASQPTDASDD